MLHCCGDDYREWDGDACTSQVVEGLMDYDEGSVATTYDHTTKEKKDYKGIEVRTSEKYAIAS